MINIIYYKCLRIAIWIFLNPQLCTPINMCNAFKVPTVFNLIFFKLFKIWNYSLTFRTIAV